MGDQSLGLNDIRVKQLERLLGAERKMRESAELNYNVARKALFDVAKSYCSVEVDELLRQGDDVEKWPIRKLLEFINQHLGVRFSRLRVGDRLGDLYEKSQARINELQKELNERNNELGQQSQRIGQLELELSAARQDLAVARQRMSKSEKPAAVAAEPQVRVVRSPGDWFNEWKEQRGYDRSMELLRLIGESGHCRRSVIENEANARWDVTSRNAITDALGLLEQYELIQQQAMPPLGLRGRPNSAISLTARGRDTFLLLFGQTAMPSELDELLKRHKTIEHVALNLAAADILQERLQAVVDHYPPTITLSGERKFMPDLVVTLPGGETLYIECERGADDGSMSVRERKWQNVFDATGGKLYIICPDSSSRNKVISEINRWAGARSVEISATDIKSLRDRQTETFWLYHRKR